MCLRLAVDNVGLRAGRVARPLHLCDSAILDRPDSGPELLGDASSGAFLSSFVESKTPNCRASSFDSGGFYEAHRVGIASEVAERSTRPAIRLQS